MTRLIRYAQFNLVGAAGMAVQLTALALFDRLVPNHYLYATAAAIELALLHNFVWHVRYTWRDRLTESAVGLRLLRFHLTNGVVSLLGNLALTRFLFRGLRLPLVASNAVAIVCCSALNFGLADLWAFSRESREGESPIQELVAPTILSASIPLAPSDPIPVSRTPTA